jgi:transcriptional regulator with XRE-family HTH domain
MRQHLRQHAKFLRKRGWSYNIIASRLGVAKSTLSHWLREIPYHPNRQVRKRIREGPAKSARIRHDAKIAAIQSAKLAASQEIGQMTQRDLWMLGLGLYIGEGTKLYETVRFINSDPEVIRAAMCWFRTICGIPNGHFSVAIHLYPDTPQLTAARFWSKVTGIPVSKFGKTQVDRRTNKSGKKQRKLPYGTAHITIHSRGDPRLGVALHRRILGWIEAVMEQARA